MFKAVNPASRDVDGDGDKAAGDVNLHQRGRSSGGAADDETNAFPSEEQQQRQQQQQQPEEDAFVFRESRDGALDASKTLHVMTFNVLADALAANDSFASAVYYDDDEGEDGTGDGNTTTTTSTSYDLNFLRRGREIIRVIATSESSTSPDVVCLQEVDRFDFFEDELRKHGYRGIFKEDPWSPCRKFGAPNDGVAIFYKTSKLELVGSHVPGVPRSRKDDPTTNAGKTLMARFRMKRPSPATGGGLLSKASAALLTRQQPVFTGVDLQEVVVVTTHLEGAKTVDGIITRLEQTKEICRALNDFATNLCADVNNVQIIIAGDLNATPNEACVVHLRGRGMRSAYADVGAAVGAEKSNTFTTWKTRTGLFKTGEVKHTIDYILYSAHRGSKVVSVAKLPSEDDIPSAVGLPTFGFPSDHLPLQARILLL